MQSTLNSPIVSYRINPTKYKIVTNTKKLTKIIYEIDINAEINLELSRRHRGS